MGEIRLGSRGFLTRRVDWNLGGGIISIETSPAFEDWTMTRRVAIHILE
jgi:hypothetical protein